MSRRGLICLLAALPVTSAALAADASGKSSIPIFATDSGTGWRIDRTVGVDDLLAAPGGGPGPITFERAHPYVPNGGGRQPTYRVADLSNPILQEWVKPAMKKANDEVLAGQAPYRAHERCWPAAVPGIDVDAFAAPVFLWQTPKEVVYVMNNGPEVRHIYLDVPHSQNPKPSWTENPSDIMKTAIRWSSTPSDSTTGSSIIIAPRARRSCMSLKGGKFRPTETRSMFPSMSRIPASSRRLGGPCTAGAA